MARRTVSELARELVRVRWDRHCRANRLRELERAAAIARGEIARLEHADAALTSELAERDADRLARVDDTTAGWFGGRR